MARMQADKTLLIILVILVILVIPVTANWRDVRSDKQNRHNFVNGSMTGSNVTFIKPDVAKFNQSLWIRASVPSAGKSGLTNKSNIDFKFSPRHNKTIEFWLFVNTTNPTDDGTNFIFFNDSAGTNVIKVTYENDNAASAFRNNLTLRIETNWAGVSIAPIDYFITHKIVNNSQWHHVALTWYNSSISGSNKKYLRAFYDGVSILTIDATSGVGKGNESRIQHFGIAYPAASSRPFAIDEIRISNSSRYTSNFTIPTAPYTLDSKTLALWHLDDTEFYQFSITQCNAPSIDRFVALNFTFYDEINRTRFNITKYVATFIAKSWNNSVKINQSLTISNSPKTISICIRPKGHVFKINSTIQYEKNGFAIRNYYQRNINLSRMTKNISLYSLISSLAIGITLDLNDELDNPLEDYLIDIQRYFIANNTYQTIAIARTDEKGNDFAYLQQNDAFYRFLVYGSDGLLKFTSQNKKITTASLVINVVPDTITEIIEGFRNINFNLTYRDPPKSFNVTYLTTDTRITKICLNVIWRTARNDTQLSNQCSSVLAGRLGFKIPNYNGTYIASVYANQNPDYILGSLIKQIRTQAATFFQRINYDGIIIAFFIIIVLAGVGAFNPSVGIVLTIIAMIIFINLELTFATYGAILVMIISGIVLLFRMKT